MSLSYTISDAEISANPATGKITGDAAPGTTQDGVVTKMAKSHDDIKTDLEALKTIFDAHDHDPATGTGGGGPLIGEGGVHAIAAGAITTAKIAAANVTYAKVAAGAVGSTATSRRPFRSRRRSRRAARRTSRIAPGDMPSTTSNVTRTTATCSPRTRRHRR